MLNRKDMKSIIEYEQKIYFPNGKISFENRYRKNLKYQIFAYIKLLRKYEYLCAKRDEEKSVLMSRFFSLCIKICDRRKNVKGTQLGIEIVPGNIGKGIKICHQNVILNGQVGENCVFHGNNVLGNKKTGMVKEVPVLGNNVDVGVGAIIIGDVKIADNCVIGAGAVVTKSFLTPGTIIAGVPAKAINMLKE